MKKTELKNAKPCTLDEMKAATTEQMRYLPALSLIAAGTYELEADKKGVNVYAVPYTRNDGAEGTYYAVALNTGDLIPISAFVRRRIITAGKEISNGAPLDCAELLTQAVEELNKTTKKFVLTHVIGSWADSATHRKGTKPVMAFVS